MALIDETRTLLTVEFSCQTAFSPNVTSVDACLFVPVRDRVKFMVLSELFGFVAL